MIDHARTMENIRLINSAELARRIGCTPPLVHLVASGKYKHVDAPKAQMVLQILRDLKILVEVPDTEAA